MTTIESGGSTSPYNHDKFYDASSSRQHFGFYDLYYDSVPFGSTIKGPGSANCLLLSNSFGTGLMPYLASTYSNTKLAPIMHPDWHKKSMRLEEMIADDPIDDVVFVADPVDFAGLDRDCPDFF